MVVPDTKRRVTDRQHSLLMITVDFGRRDTEMQDKLQTCGISSPTHNIMYLNSIQVHNV